MPAESRDINSEEDFEHFFEGSLCGFLTATPKGIIKRGNARVAEWTGYGRNELAGKKFPDLLSIGGKIYYETHLSPLLKMQGYFDEVVLDLLNISSGKIKVIVNALECKNENGEVVFIRYTLFKASDRLQYEQNLQHAKLIAEKELSAQREIVALREQLIAVLGHDLRNPLNAIHLATEILESSEMSVEDVELIATIKRSSSRMIELVNNIMDFARTRLGEGILLNLREVNLKPVFLHVIREMQIIFPQKEIRMSFEIDEPVICDRDRIAQLLSNLIANAITHGSQGTPVYIRAKKNDNKFEFSVTNNGNAIPESLRQNIFTPLTRESTRQSQNGLGLGLYISSEIAKAHKASLTYISNAEETRFTFIL